MIQLVSFYIFASIVIASAAMVIFARNPVHSVLWLIVAFFNAAGLMVLIGAEFIAMRMAVEEAISIRYMLRCLGIPVTTPTDMYGDNFGVIQSAEIPEGELKKKHIAISYHYVREAIAAKIVNAHWIRSHENFADVCTKALGTNIFCDLVEALMA